MNVLEHHIVSIISVEPYDMEWTNDYDDKYVKITAVVNCHGDVRRMTDIQTELEWETNRARGYILR